MIHIKTQLTRQDLVGVIALGVGTAWTTSFQGGRHCMIEKKNEIFFATQVKATNKEMYYGYFKVKQDGIPIRLYYELPIEQAGIVCSKKYPDLATYSDKEPEKFSKLIQ